MALALGTAAVFATLLGGTFALASSRLLHLTLAFSAGAVLGVALFDLLPESFDLAGEAHEASTVALFVGLGFFAYLVFNHVGGMHRRGAVGAASLSLHSFLDGVGIGLAFKVSPAVGAVVAAAVLAHDFSDGINTVNIVLRDRENRLRALRWLAFDALAPLAGVASTFLYTLSEPHLGLVLAVFCGFFLYIGASDLLPESRTRHPAAVTGVLNAGGAALIWLTIHLAAI
jgi:zinc transporter ZupT